MLLFSSVKSILAIRLFKQLTIKVKAEEEMHEKYFILATTNALKMKWTRKQKVNSTNYS